MKEVRKMLNRKGQNIAEYSILIALVIAAAVAMQTYVKRGLQGRIADAVDNAPTANLGDAGTIQFTTKQYEPYYIDSSGNVVSDRKYGEALGARGETTRTITQEETRREIGAYEKATWESETTR